VALFNINSKVCKYIHVLLDGLFLINNFDDGVESELSLLLGNDITIKLEFLHEVMMFTIPLTASFSYEENINQELKKALRIKWNNNDIIFSCPMGLE